MRRVLFTNLALSASLAASQAVSCPIVFDGRVPATAKLADFDASNGGGWMPFNPDYVKGEGLKWSSILKLPTGLAASRFDKEKGTVPLQVTLSDKSIFMTQRGFRRAGLQFLKDSNDGSPASKGRKTIHFSIMTDKKMPLNLTHEYLNVWHETAAYDANQFNFEMGQIIGQTGLARDTFKVLNRQNRQIFSTPIVDEIWHNFAITLDFDRNTLQVYYSKNNDTLAKGTEAVSNSNAGNGQYQIGMLKKPTGTSDVVNSGYQSSGLNEGLIYGGVFIEDSASNCVSL